MRSHVRRFILILLWTAVYGQHWTPDPYAQVSIGLVWPDGIQRLAAEGYPVEDGWFDREGNFHLPVPGSAVAQLVAEGWKVMVDIPDLTTYFQERNVPAVQREFPLGSLLGNYTLEEALARMDSLALRYPNLVSPRDSIGATIENRAIWAFKVSDNPTQDEDEPEVLYTGLTHAREPLGMMNLFYFVQQICEGYGTDPELTFLANERELWFIPIVNVDGYVYNQTMFPGGGGMQRKNRRDTGCGPGTERGVDLNRNFDYDWGGPGSSGYPCDPTFHGDSAFSEPESRAVRDFILAHDFSNVLHYHAYGNVLIFPFGDGTYPPEPDETTFREIGAAMTVVNHFPVGTGIELLNYGVSGDQADWTYGVAGLLSYIPEVGTNNDNFWPPENRVLPLCQEQVVANTVFARVAGPDLWIKPYSTLQPVLVADSTVSVVIANRGLRPAASVSLSLRSLNALTVLGDSLVTLASLAQRSQDTLVIPFTYALQVIPGMEAGIIVQLTGDGLLPLTDTLRWFTGVPAVLLADDFESGLENWDLSMGTWGLSDDAWEGQYSLADSPTGPYASQENSVIQLNAPLDLRGLAHPTLNYVAHWDIEPNWDFAQVQAWSPGTGIVSLAGHYTSPGSGQGVQPLGEPGYHGRQNAWVQESVDLSPVANRDQVLIRFVLLSDQYVQRDGITIDDLSVRGYPAFLPGDVTIDHRWSVDDVLTGSDWLETGPLLTPLQRMLLDMDENGIVEENDLTQLIDHILGNQP